ncbi:MAG: type 4a pilus biogenesis protein PilO [Candidatus Omnitrophota bacterium]
MQEFLKKFSKREKMVLYASIAFVLIALIDRVILYPIIHKMKTLEENIKTTEYEMSKNSKILMQRKKIEAEEKKYSSFIVKPGSTEEEKAALLKEIEGLANTNYVHLNNLKTQEVIKKGATQMFPLNISCEAEIEDLVVFMYSIEKSSMLIQINAFEISPKSKQSNLIRCELMVYKIAIP